MAVSFHTIRSIDIFFLRVSLFISYLFIYFFKFASCNLCLPFISICNAKQMNTSHRLKHQSLEISHQCAMPSGLIEF